MKPSRPTIKLKDMIVAPIKDDEVIAIYELLYLSRMPEDAPAPTCDDLAVAFARRQLQDAFGVPIGLTEKRASGVVERVLNQFLWFIIVGLVITVIFKYLPADRTTVLGLFTLSGIAAFGWASSRMRGNTTRPVTGQNTVTRPGPTTAPPGARTPPLPNAVPPASMPQKRPGKDE